MRAMDVQILKSLLDQKSKVLNLKILETSFYDTPPKYLQKIAETLKSSVLLSGNTKYIERFLLIAYCISWKDWKACFKTRCKISII